MAGVVARLFLCLKVHFDRSKNHKKDTLLLVKCIVTCMKLVFFTLKKHYEKYYFSLLVKNNLPLFCLFFAPCGLNSVKEDYSIGLGAFKHSNTAFSTYFATMII